MDGQALSHKIDPLLLPFLQTTDEAEARLLLDRLIELAAPMIKKVTSWSQDPEDAFQEAAQRLIEQLWGFKANPDSKAISNYFHYVKVYRLACCQRAIARSASATPQPDGCVAPCSE